MYEVLSNPRARHGQDLLDIGGKVEFISIARAKDNMPEVARIDDPQQVEALVHMVLAAPITLRSNTANQQVYPLIFELKDATRVGCGVNLDADTVGKFAVSEAFSQAIEQALTNE